MRPTPLASAYESEARGTTELLGWAYPAQFSDAAEEHHWVRAAAGLFDFSFMYDPPRERVRATLSGSLHG